MEATTSPFYQRYRRTLTLLAVPAWVVFIVLIYLKTHPHDQTGSGVNVLRVGALPR